MDKRCVRELRQQARVAHGTYTVEVKGAVAGSIPPARPDAT
jgi:hypothetical protein